MAYTTNIETIERNLKRLNVPVEKAKKELLNGGDGFGINYNHLADEPAKKAVGQLRTTLYSWLDFLNLKEHYTVTTKEKSVLISKKLIVANAGYVPVKDLGGGVFTERESELGCGVPDEEQRLQELQLSAELGLSKADEKEFSEIMERRLKRIEEELDKEERESVTVEKELAAITEEVLTSENKPTFQEILQKEGQKLKDSKFKPEQHGLQDVENSFEE